MYHIHRQAALSLLKSSHSVTAATVQGGWRGRPDAPRRGVRNLVKASPSLKMGDIADLKAIERPNVGLMHSNAHNAQGM